MKNLLKLFSLLTIAGFMLASCEGPMGPAGADGLNGADGSNGTNGLNGQDANETCKLCHNPEVVEAIAAQYAISKHGSSELALEEAGNTSCAPCHESTGFHYVVNNSVPATYTMGTSSWSTDYKSSATATYGDIDCFTCHSSLHTTYDGTDFAPLTTVAAVPLAMWAGAKTVNLTQDGGLSNLCVKCHQPRPMSYNSKNPIKLGNVMDYNDLATNPTEIIYDQTIGKGNDNLLIPSYRTHVHYGTVGAVYAGVGGVQFTGSQSYTSSPHTTLASCKDCHMATMNGASGGHSFYASGNFNGCNVTGCHSSSPITSASTAKFKDTQTAVKALLNALAVKINAVGGGTDILHKDEENLWAAATTNHYDGYLDMYDASSNPTGYWQNPNPSSSWSTAAVAENAAKPLLPSLTKGVLGAMINFQFCLRESSLGIHNTAYVKALLQNSIDIL